MTAGRRDQLASALSECFIGSEATVWADTLTDTLWPVVDRMIRQAQAEALREAAFDLPTGLSTAITRAWLRDRAAALSVTTDRRDVTQDAP